MVNESGWPVSLCWPVNVTVIRPSKLRAVVTDDSVTRGSHFSTAM
ncbi:hypothetical protein L339_01741 [Escherichia coli E1777]|nr:hypothetical protein L339_01741 [Escherichia coli E1777]